MPTFNDLFQNAGGRGFVGNQGIDFGGFASGENRAQGGLGSLIPVDAADLQWASGYSGYNTTRAPHSYFDYYFTGQDVFAYIDGTEDDPEFSKMPIMQLGFNVSQQKAPVYGFWSYTYDGVMRGTRLVSGVFTIATKGPDYIRNVLTKAAEGRANRARPYSYNRGMTEDDSKIEQYWGKHLDPAITSAGNNVFGIHPPFSFVVVYGVQSDSLGLNQNEYYADLYDGYHADNALHQDMNERVVESDPVHQASRVVLEACEIQSMETMYSPEGQPLAETYQFFARDIIIPARWNGNATSSMPTTHGDGTVDNANRTSTSTGRWI